MVRALSTIMRLFTVRYQPQCRDASFLDRAQRQSNQGLDVTVSVLSDRESDRFFGVSLSHRGLQAVWIECENNSDRNYRLDFYSVDPSYYTPLEAAHICHFSAGKRLLSFGLLAWLFLPCLPLLPFKLLGARRANRRMDQLFKRQSFRFGPLLPGDRRRGVVFTALDEGTKNVNLEFVHRNSECSFNFSVEVPGLEIRSSDESSDREGATEIGEGELRQILEQFQRCTANRAGTKEGDPLNLVVVADRATIRKGFGGRWDEAEAITWKTCLKTAKAFLLEAGYRYSPVSSLYVNGQMQQLALQKARSSINERIHLRLWSTTYLFHNRPVWIGQVSRDIGVRFTPKTWNLTTHRIDPDADESRDYVVDYLLQSRRVSSFGYVGGVDVAPESAPRKNLTGDPYFTDGDRAVLVMSLQRVEATYLEWIDP